MPSTQDRPQATKPDIRHLQSCPAERTETYSSGPNDEVTITRCIDCGEYVVTGTDETKES
jgi:hypothetical protein